MSPSLFTSFRRAQVASVLATVVDFATLVGLVELAHLWYVAATAVGALFGALTNFVINRHWSFEAAGRGIHRQAFRYGVVSAGSLVLNSLGVFALTDGLGFQYAVSKALVALSVGVLYNFPLHRRFVFG